MKLNRTRLVCLAGSLLVTALNTSAQQSGTLPRGYDNSWKVMVTLSRSQVNATDLVSTIYPKCKSTIEASGNFSIQAEFSSDQMVGISNGDDFQLFTDVDEKLKKFIHPLKGGYKLQFMQKNTTANCNSSTKTNESGQCVIDPSGIHVTFNYNKKTKKGDFSVSMPDDYTIQANGTITSKTDGNAAVTLNTDEQTKAAMEMMFAACGNFSAANYALSNDSRVEQALQNSPVTGGLASIGEMKNGYDISYSFTKTETPKNNDGYTGSNSIMYTTNVHIFITNQEPPGLEAVIEPTDTTEYRNFIPEGPKLDGSSDEGNFLGFRVRIVDKKKKGADVTSAHPFTVTYTLDHVSAYKGICMNYPRENADEKPDLKWSKMALAETHLKSSTESTLTSNEREGDGLAAYVTSIDYAAYGIITAHVHLNDDALDLEAHLKNKPDEFSLSIPLDDNHNKIADKWEKDVGMYSKTSDADYDEDEQPKDQRRSGDGYTMFEEYRGFKVNDNLLAGGSHETFKNSLVRMDPNYKDIFINDESGLFKTYYAGYNPAELCWHYIDRNEMIFNARGKDPENRQTNFNKVPEHFYARQHAIILEKKPGLFSDGEVGHALSYVRLADFDTHQATDEGLSATLQGFDQAVKKTIVVDVYTDEVTNLASKQKDQQHMQNYYNDIVAGTVIHEVGHALGITHHLRPDGSEDDIGLTLGVNDCAMRYQSDDEQRHNINMLLVRYCRKGETWKELVKTPDSDVPSGNSVPLNTVTRPAHNCFGEIDVKSDPGD